MPNFPELTSNDLASIQRYVRQRARRDRRALQHNRTFHAINHRDP
jgi:hypothetical protein